MTALAIILAAAAPSTLDVRSGQVIDLFVRVCLQGEARFKKGDVEKLDSTAVPYAMNAFNRKGDFYRVRRPTEAWIAVTDGGTDSRTYSRICRVSAKYVDVRDAADRVRAWLREPPLPRGLPLAEYEEYYLGGGARFEISQRRFSDWVVLQSYILTPEAAERTKRKLDR